MNLRNLLSTPEEYERARRWHRLQATADERIYFDCHWIGNDEFEGPCARAFNRLFVGIGDIYSTRAWREDIVTVTGPAGYVLTESDYLAFQAAMKSLGETHLYIVENFIPPIPKNATPPLRIRFHVDDSWEYISSGGAISFRLFELAVGDFFIFGDTGIWGKLVLEDVADPFEMIGFATSMNLDETRASLLSTVRPNAKVRMSFPPGYEN